MIVNISDLEMGLKQFKLAKSNISIVQEIITKQLFLYQHLKLDPSNVSLIIIGKKIDGVDTIRVFEKNNVLIDILDTSYNKLKNLSSLEDWNTNYIFWISFLENGKYLDIVKCKLSDIENLKVKKVKVMTYGVTDGEDVVSIVISQQDVKGTDYNVLKDVVTYTFNKRTGKKSTNLDFMAIGYS